MFPYKSFAYFFSNKKFPIVFFVYVFGSVFDLDPPFGGRNGCGGFWIKKYGKDIRNGYNGHNGMSPGIAAAGTKEPDAGRKNFPFFW